MDNLRIPLSSITEDGLPVDVRTAVRTVQPADVEPLPVEEVTVRGTIFDMDQNYLFQGRLAGVYVHPCDRCLEEARVPFDAEVMWNFEPGPEITEAGVEPGNEAPEGHDFDDERRTYQGEEIDLRPHVWEELVLMAPLKYICREDCKGLCPQCGVNHNVTDCACQVDESEQWRANTGLASLADMFPDLARKKPKE